MFVFIEQNGTIYCYFSQLIEQGFLDIIHVNFMIVGHTHAPIDQIFSSYTKIKRKACFIGTPAALFYYIQNHGQGSRCYRKPIVCKQLDVFFDYVKAFKPFLNKSIRYFGVPHVFRGGNIVLHACNVDLLSSFENN